MTTRTNLCRNHGQSMNMTKDAGHSPGLQRLRDLHAVFIDALDRKLAVATTVTILEERIC
ncbi:hypothetical protein CTA1_12994 [Colletotrichum tanaceti]|uniref:Uncharacterized protein n=1 Tax=Colletotrichum tanaceti TaxID=1306861 RepID=A0A4V6DFY1_9PEZI|nr:hypothetical protein CTA1_12994 [Colletotrichum tanaceti]